MTDQQFRLHIGTSLLISLGVLIPALARCQELDKVENAEVEVNGTEESREIPQTLRWQLPVDIPLQLTLQQTTQTITTVFPRTLRMRVETTATFEWQVESVSEQGEMQIRQTLRALRLLVVPPESSEPILFDSTASDPLRGAARDLANSVTPLLGTQMTLTLNTQGEVLSVEIPEGTRDAYQKLAAGGGTPERFTPETLRTLVERTLVPFPAEPVVPGSTWEGTVEIARPQGPRQQSGKYIYRGIDHDGEREPEPTGSNVPGLHRIDLQTELTELLGDEHTATSAPLEGHEATGWYDWNPELSGITRGQITQRLLTKSAFQGKPVIVRLTSEFNWQLRSNSP